jgi:hypothetical protein
MDPQNRTAEQILAQLAFHAHGIVDRWELLDAGITAQQIKRRLQSGALIPEFPGVYRVGHAAPSTDAHFLAAVRACGAGALLCGHAAAHTYGLRRGEVPMPEVAARTERRVEGIVTHRWRRIDPRDVTVVRAIPITRVPRTLVDIAAALTLDELARACHEAGVKYGTTPAHVEAALSRRPNARAARNLRLVMSGDAKVMLSKLERAFIRFLKAHGFPLPETNRIASGRRVDCRWPAYRLTVELDSFRYHNSRYSWEQGLQREREARRRGDEFRRFSWEDVMNDQRYMLAELRKFLPSNPALRVV